MARPEAVEVDGHERRPRPAEVAAHPECDLLVHALGHDVAARILAHVRGPTRPPHVSGNRLEEPGGKLGERRLPGAVLAGQRDHLAAANLEVRYRDDPLAVRV